MDSPNNVQKMDFLHFKVSVAKSLVLENQMEEDIDHEVDGGQPESKPPRKHTFGSLHEK